MAELNIASAPRPKKLKKEHTNTCQCMPPCSQCSLTTARDDVRKQEADLAAWAFSNVGDISIPMMMDGEDDVVDGDGDDSALSEYDSSSRQNDQLTASFGSFILLNSLLVLTLANCERWRFGTCRETHARNKRGARTRCCNCNPERN